VKVLPNPSFDDFKYRELQGSVPDLSALLDSMELEVDQCVDKYLESEGIDVSLKHIEKWKRPKPKHRQQSPKAALPGAEDMEAMESGMSMSYASANLTNSGGVSDFDGCRSVSSDDSAPRSDRTVDVERQRSPANKSSRHSPSSSRRLAAGNRPAAVAKSPDAVEQDPDVDCPAPEDDTGDAAAAIDNATAEASPASRLGKRASLDLTSARSRRSVASARAQTPKLAKVVQEVVRRQTYAGTYLNGRFHKATTASVDDLTEKDKEALIADMQEMRQKKIEELMERQRVHAARQLKKKMQEVKVMRATTGSLQNWTRSSKTAASPGDWADAQDSRPASSGPNVVNVGDNDLRAATHPQFWPQGKKGHASHPQQLPALMPTAAEMRRLGRSFRC